MSLSGRYETSIHGYWIITAEKTVSEIHAMYLVEEICIHLKVQSEVNHREVQVMCQKSSNRDQKEASGIRQLKTFVQMDSMGLWF